MKTIEVSRSKIDVISDYVSEVVHSFVDDTKFGGAFVSCKGANGVLTDVSLNLVYFDYRFKGDYSLEELDKVCVETGVNVTVEKVPYWFYGGEQRSIFEHPNKEKLKSGTIIYDYTGNLTEVQRLAQLNSKVDDLEKEGVVVTEPPIQYKKTM